MKPTARRYNSGKSRYDLISHEAMEEISKVYTRGAEKYSDISEEGEIIYDAGDDWRKGQKWMDTMGSVERHIQSWKHGEDLDELGTNHLANAAWGLMTLLAYYKIFPEGDDRRHSYLSQKIIYLDIDSVLSDFTGHLMDYLKIDGPIPHDWDDHRVRDSMPQIFHDEKFWVTMPRLIDPATIPFKISGYCTQRSIDKDITQKWLDDNGFPRAELLSISSKQDKAEFLAKTEVDIFVDDNYDNFIKLNRAGICCFLMSASHNIKYNVGYKRINSLLDLAHFA